MTETKKEMNIGICLLKIIMCLMVILVHFYVNPVNGLGNLCKSACPVFMIISFLFVSKIFTEQNFEKLMQRLVRLAIPFYLWGIVFSVIFFIANYFLHFNSNIKSDILWQLLVGHGHCINSPLWYLFDAMIITALFYLIFRFFSRNCAIFIVLALLVCSVLMQYSGLNYKLFGNLVWGLKYPLGRFCEMFPYAGIGFFLGHNNIINKFNFNKTYQPQILILLVMVLSLFVSFNGPQNQFGYSGIFSIILSLVFVVLFYNLHIKCEILKNIIIYISKYTLGIYCMHYGVGQIYKMILPKILHINIQSIIYQISLCILIFVTALLISVILYKIGNKYKIIKQMVS